MSTIVRNANWHFLTFFKNSWDFLVQIWHTYYTFLSTLDYKFLSNYLQMRRSYAILSATPEPEEEPPYPPAGGKGAHDAQGPHVTYDFFSSFLMFSKFLWRYSCTMKSTGSVVTYLIFEFLITTCYTYIRVQYCIVHSVYKNSLLFSLEY